MKKKLVAALLFLAHFAFGQSVSELETRLNKSSDRAEKMRLAYQIAEKLLPTSPAKASDFANRAFMLASDVGDKVVMAEASFLNGEGFSRQRDYPNAALRYKRGLQYAKEAGGAGAEAALDCLAKLEEIAVRDRDFKNAHEWSKQAVALLQKGSPGAAGRDLDKKFAAQRERLQLEKQAMEQEKARIQAELGLLRQERDHFKTGLDKTSQELLKTKTESETLIESKEKALDDLSDRAAALDSLSDFQGEQLAFLTKEQIADSLKLAKSEKELGEKNLALANEKLRAKQNENLRNVLLLVSAFVLALAGLFYARFRAKKKAGEALEQKNRLIEAERERSDNLLLNILPPAIAAELKAEGKAAAKKYEQATVMFVDFVNFTSVAERLTPEALVDELDYCFRQFDAIISQFNIEKIKTIGDAYMCANGLSDRNALPDDMIKAALEMQEFLTNLSEERSRRGLPFFAARVGIHTGPVVAGVVGAKKFAYDIWGDTVNIAARMEQACEPGRVNVSDATKELSKYLFQFENRGRIEAKNKGAIEMFYVAGRY